MSDSHGAAHKWDDPEAESTFCRDCGLRRVFRGFSSKERPTYAYIHPSVYRVGSRVRLLRIADDEPLEPGAEGVVTGETAEGVPLVEWSGGITLGVIPGVDEIELVEEIAHAS